MKRQCKWKGCITILTYNKGACCRVHQPGWHELKENELEDIHNKIILLKKIMPSLTKIATAKGRLDMLLKQREKIGQNQEKMKALFKQIVKIKKEF